MYCFFFKFHLDFSGQKVKTKFAAFAYKVTGIKEQMSGATKETPLCATRECIVMPVPSVLITDCGKLCQNVLLHCVTMIGALQCGYSTQTIKSSSSV